MSKMMVLFVNVRQIFVYNFVNALRLCMNTAVAKRILLLLCSHFVCQLQGHPTFKLYNWSHFVEKDSHIQLIVFLHSDTRLYR